MRACPWSESVGEGGGGGVIRITVEPSVAANWVTEGSYIRVYVGRYTLRTASATLLSTRRFRNPSQPPGILLWSARQNATQNPPSTAIGFRPTHYPFCRPFNLIRHDRHWQHDNRVTWQYFDKDSLRRNICRLQFVCTIITTDIRIDVQWRDCRISTHKGLIKLEPRAIREIFRIIKYFRDTKQNIIRIRGTSDVIFPLIFLLWSEHCFCSRYPPIRAAPFVHPSRPFRDRTQDRKRNQRILALLCSLVLTNERLSRDKIAPVDSPLAANPHVWARRISIGEFLRERSRSFSPESKRPSLRAFTETRPQNRKLQFLPNVEERTSENASKFIRDRQIFIGQRRGTRRTYTRGNLTFGARPKPLLRPGGGLEYSGPSYSRQRTALRRDITSVHATVILEFIFPLSSFPKNQARAFPSRSCTPEMSFRFGPLPVCFRVTPCVYAFLFRDCAKYFAWSNYTEGKIFPCLHISCGSLFKKILGWFRDYQNIRVFTLPKL